MDSFTAIDFETANASRESACALGYAIVDNGQITSTGSHLIKPIGGHAPFQSQIHGITSAETHAKPDFGALIDDIAHIFRKPLAGYSLFDQQVLNALCDHFDMGLRFDYTDVYSLARLRLPELAKHKLKTVAAYLDLPAFKPHDTQEEAATCARVLLALTGAPAEGATAPNHGSISEFKGLIYGILADDVVNYKEAYTLLYWLEDHPEMAQEHHKLYQTTKEALYDDHLDRFEAIELRTLLRGTL